MKSQRYIDEDLKAKITKMINHHIKLPNCTIHAIDTGPRGETLPFIYIPGIAGTAEDGVFFKDAFPERRCISLSMRGRGLSSTPLRQYAIADHAADIAGILESLDIESGKFHLHGYSVSVMYTLSFILLKKILPATLTLGDHSAAVEKLPQGWAKDFSNARIQGRSILDSIRMAALNEIEADSKNESLFVNLLASEWQIPVLLLYGGDCGPVPSRVTEHDIQHYKKIFKSLKLCHFPKSGHFFRDTEREAYLSAIGSFIGKFDV